MLSSTAQVPDVFIGHLRNLTHSPSFSLLGSSPFLRVTDSQDVSQQGPFTDTQYLRYSLSFFLYIGQYYLNDIIRNLRRQ